MLDDVQAQDIAIARGKLAQSFHRSVVASSDAVGVAVMNELGLETRFDHVAYRMVDDTVAKGCCADAPPLGLVDVEMRIWPRPVVPAEEFFLKPEQSIRQSMLESSHRRTAALPTGSLLPGTQQVFEAGDAIKT